MIVIVKLKCSYCRAAIKDTDETVEVSIGVVHKKCYDERQKLRQEAEQRRKEFEANRPPKSEPKPKQEKPEKEQKPRKINKKICFYCNQSFDINREEFCMARVNRYAHKKCYEKYHINDDNFIDEIYSFLKEEVLVTYDFIQCERQRKSYVEKFGYTNEGILNALRYFYLVKKQSPERSGNRIGIVPYVYNEAKEYYETLKKRQKILTKTAVEQMDKKPKIIKVSLPEKPVDKGYIDLDSIDKGVD